MDGVLSNGTVRREYVVNSEREREREREREHEHEHEHEHETREMNQQLL